MNYLAYRARDVILHQIGYVNSPRYVCVTLYDKMSLALREKLRNLATPARKIPAGTNLKPQLE